MPCLVYFAPSQLRKTNFTLLFELWIIIQFKVSAKIYLDKINYGLTLYG